MSPSVESAPVIASPEDGLPRWSRRLISAWLLFHLFAIVIAPASVAPASGLARSGWAVCRPYLQALYLNHGYHYFAPDPGESTLLAFTVERADGTIVEDAIPHPRIWPRLLYHRHFMLTESLAFVAASSESRIREEEFSIARVDREIRGGDAFDTGQETIGGADSAMQAAQTGISVSPPLRGLIRDWYQSYARCILDRYDGQRVRLTRVVHYLPEIEWMQESIAVGEPLTLGEPASFAEFAVGEFDRHNGPHDSLRQIPRHPSQPPASQQSELVLLPTKTGIDP